jgi:hypothetical protein
VGYPFSSGKTWIAVKIFKGGEINEKDFADNFIVGFGFGVGRVSPTPLAVSW